MKYIIVTASSAISLEKMVSEQLKEGWEPQGGVAICRFGAETMHYQAIVRQN